MKVSVCGILLLVATAGHAASFPSPQDWRDENIYFIFTDRFNDGEPTNNTAEVARGVSYLPSSSNGGIHGGDLKGVEKKLDYIKALGATAIWITPIPLNAAGSAYHGYGAQDFNTLAPHLGTMADLSNMVNAAHARNIKVILDIVCNHGGDLIYSTDSGYSAYKAPPNGYNITYRNSNNQYAPPFNTNSVAPLLSSMFHTNGHIGSYVNPEQIYGELAELDDFRTETVYVRTNMVNVFSNWIVRADLDGFRALPQFRQCEQQHQPPRRRALVPLHLAGHPLSLLRH
jgi:glycosidase